MGKLKSGAGRVALMGKMLVGLMVGAAPTAGWAAESDVQFQNLISDMCNLVVVPEPGVVWDMAKLGELCSAVGTAGGGGASLSLNLGSSTASATRAKKKVPAHSDEQAKAENGASADGSSWGLLITPQYGKGTRIETEQENGYESDLKGVAIGLDHRYTDRLILGGVVAHNKEQAAFLDNAGSLKTTGYSLSIYGTWLASDEVSFDAYLGFGKLDLESSRSVNFDPIIGVTNGNTSGKQQLAGVSVRYLGYFGSVGVSPFANFDYIKTSINGYNEIGSAKLCPDPFIPSNTFSCGSELLALRYGERSVTSSTGSIGVQLDASYEYKWGALLPMVRVTAVHEFQNKIRKVGNELVYTPGAGLVVETDEPDRNFLNLGFGLVAAMNGGAQFFLDYEKHTQDKLLSNWAVSLGGLFEF